MRRNIFAAFDEKPTWRHKMEASINRFQRKKYSKPSVKMPDNKSILEGINSKETYLKKIDPKKQGEEKKRKYKMLEDKRLTTACLKRTEICNSSYSPTPRKVTQLCTRVGSGEHFERFILHAEAMATSIFRFRISFCCEVLRLISNYFIV